MAWESRQRGTRYYVSKEWRQGRCVSVYRGTGMLAELCEAVNQSARAQRQEQRQRQYAQAIQLKKSCQPQEAALQQAYNCVERILQDVLTEAGYHRQQRHQWRKKRSMATKKQIVGKEAAAEPSPPAEPTRLELITQARFDKSAFAQLNQQQTPEAQEHFFLGIFDSMFDIGEQWAKEADNFTQEALRRKLRTVEVELGSETAPPLERLLIQRIAACWMDLTMREAGYRRALASAENNPAVIELRDKLLTQAQKRYLAAVKSLAEVRKLNLPDVTLQAIEKQINVVGVQANMVQTGQKAQG